MKMSVISISLFEHFCKNIEPGMEVDLVKDRNTPLSKKVIRCEFNGDCLGYVSAKKTVRWERGCVTNEEAYDDLSHTTRAVVLERFVETVPLFGTMTVLVVETA